VVQNALKRLGPQEAYDRVFRLRRAMQVLGPRAQDAFTMLRCCSSL
jgi:hypothetical protein